MARARTTYLGLNRSGNPLGDPWDAVDDHQDLYNKLDAISRGVTTRDSNSGNQVISSDAKAGMHVSATGDAVRGRVVGLSTDDDAIFVWVDNDGSTLTDKFAIGFNDGDATFGINPGAALDGGGLTVDANDNVKAAAHFTIGAATQDYEFADRAAFLTLQSKTAATAMALEMFSADGDATDDVSLRIYGAGTPGAVTNWERLVLQYDNANGRYLMLSDQGGSGTLRPIVFETEGNANQFNLATDGDVSVGILAGDGTFHVHTATAGSVTADSSGDDLVIENSAGGGATILTPDASESRLIFGSATDDTGAALRWKYGAAGADKLLTVGAWTAGGKVRVSNGSMTERMRWDAGQVLLGTTQVATGSVARVLIFGDNTGDPAPGADTAGLFAKDVTASMEMFAVDEADNVTQISPHNPTTGEFYFRSHNTRTGRQLTIHMERLVQFLIAKVSPLLSPADRTELAAMVEDEIDESLIISAEARSTRSIS